LSWPDDALFTMWFQKPAPDDGFTAKMQRAFNACLAATSVEPLQEEGGKLKDVMDSMKQRNAENFGRLIGLARMEPLQGERFSNAWFSGIANRVKADPASKPLSEIVSTLNAYHEFEESKLQVALANKDYNP
jgi:hypothetical protein